MADCRRGALLSRARWVADAIRAAFANPFGNPAWPAVNAANSWGRIIRDLMWQVCQWRHLMSILHRIFMELKRRRLLIRLIELPKGLLGGLRGRPVSFRLRVVSRNDDMDAYGVPFYFVARVSPPRRYASSLHGRGIISRDSMCMTRCRTYRAV